MEVGSGKSEPAWLRRLSHRESISWQHTKTWKHSEGPDFETKKSAWGAVRSTPQPGVVVCYDQLGPLELRPVAEMCWAQRQKPQRHRATYPRKQGIEQLHGFYAVHADCLVGQVRKRKTARDIPACFAKRVPVTRSNFASTWSWTTYPRVRPPALGK